MLRRGYEFELLMTVVNPLVVSLREALSRGLKGATETGGLF
jgi:hypothetical protein